MNEVCSLLINFCFIIQTPQNTPLSISLENKWRWVCRTAQKIVPIVYGAAFLILLQRRRIPFQIGVHSVLYVFNVAEFAHL